MTEFVSLAWPVFLIICALAAAYGLVIAAKHRKKWLPPLEELVTLDSRGWLIVATVSTAGAGIMIATSQLFSSTYWLGLAINADGKTVPEHWFPLGWFGLISVGTISAFALSVIFELVADIGAPSASGLKKEKKKGTPEILLIVTALCIVMSLASKWGFYEDTRQTRAIEAAQVAATDAGAADRLKEANATIERLIAAPSVEIAAATEAAIAKQITDLEAQRTEAIAARDALPINQGTNRLGYQRTIDGHTETLGALEIGKIEAQKIREDAATLAKARADKAAAEETLRADAGKLTEEKTEKVRIGDTVIIRLLRAGLHQALCFLFPIIALDAWATARKVKSREVAAQRGAETRRNNNPNAVRDAEFEPAPETETAARFGGYVGADPPAEGQEPQDAEIDGDDDETDTGEGPIDANT